MNENTMTLSELILNLQSLVRMDPSLADLPVVAIEANSYDDKEMAFNVTHDDDKIYLELHTGNGMQW